MDASEKKRVFVAFIISFCAFTTIYIAQPIQPEIQNYFETSAHISALSITLVLAGISIGSIPSGYLNDRYRIRTIVIPAILSLIIFSMALSKVKNLQLFLTLRFFSGLLIPLLTSGMAAYLSKNLSSGALHVGIGWYISATILGGMTGRLLGGVTAKYTFWGHAFLLSSIILTFAALIALFYLHENNKKARKNFSGSYLTVFREKKIWPPFVYAFIGQNIFSSIFNTLPFYLSGSPFSMSTEKISLLYSVYIVGLFTGAISSRLNKKLSWSANVQISASTLIISLVMLCSKTPQTIILALIIFCLSFFILHTVATSQLNKLIDKSHGRSNSVYVVFYYLGAFTGSLWSIFIFQSFGWISVIKINTILCIGIIFLSIKKNFSTVKFNINN